MTSIRFNVIVPTRERADVLFHCLRTVLAQDYENFNVIVSDNFSQDHTEDVVRSFADKRIRYVNTGARLSMAHNWEFALGHVSSGWVMILGDDDGLYPGALQTLNRLIAAHGVEALSSIFGDFQWPEHFADNPDGSLLVPLTNFARVRSSKDELRKVFSGSAFHCILPWLYHGGAASLDLINRARDQNGRFFRSQIPDLYSAVALSFATDRYLQVGIPIMISGASKHSTGASQWSSPPDDTTSPMAKFMSEGNIPFHEKLVLGKSMQIMLYEAYLQSWHLHQGALGVSLASQLDIAVKIAPPQDFQAICADCATIAAKNGLPFTAPAKPRKRRLLKFLSPRFQRAFWFAQVRPTDLGVANVYDAAMASSYIYKFIWSDSTRRNAVLLFNLIRRSTSKLNIARKLSFGSNRERLSA